MGGDQPLSEPATVGLEMGRVTLQTIADRVGVSRMTVSNAFSRPDQLSDDLRTRVLAVADELGYVGPDPSARALAKGSTGAVGMLLTDSLSEAFADEVSTTFLAAVADNLAGAGLALTLLTAGAQHHVVPARDVAMDGVLVYLCDPDSPDVGWLRRRRLPMVGVDQEPVAGVAHVNVDDRAGARQAADYLISLGHRRIGIVNLIHYGEPRILPADEVHPYGYAGDQRMLGWRDVLDTADVTTSVAVSPFRPVESAYDAAKILLAQPDRPTGILCYSDVFAAQTMRAARDLGLQVPRDISVIGFDDSPLAAQLEPPLTTIRQDLQAKAEAGVALLTKVLAARQAGAPEPTSHVMLPVELVVRHSTGPAPKASRRKRS